MHNPPFIVIPNWNGRDYLGECLDSLATQTIPHQVVVVDNGSTDGSQELLKQKYPDVHLIERDRNYGFVGGVNPGIEYALEQGAEFVALFNNDAIAAPDWLEQLVKTAEANPEAGIVTSKIKRLDGEQLDSTGDFYSIWGLPFPRGRDEVDKGQYDHKQEVFGASGGASLYRAAMLRQIGLFDQDFFAYYEDVDISFRAQLAGWKVRFCPEAVCRHHVGATSSRHAGFGRYHTVKNFHYAYVKNMPVRLYWKYFPLYILMIGLMFGSDLRRGLLKSNLKGNWTALIHLPSMLRKRRRIQKGRRVTTAYIDQILYHQLPPTQRSFHKLRQRLAGRI